MIRSFADKMKVKQEAYKAKQKVLAEQAEQVRIQKEEEVWQHERLAEIEKHKQIIAKDAYGKEQEYLREKRKQDAITARRIAEHELIQEDRASIHELSKKIVAEGEIELIERYIARSQQKSKVKRKKGINEGMPMNSSSTWQLTWKSFSTRPEIIDLPMSQKIRLYKMAERQQADKLNYAVNIMGSGIDWEDGVVDHINFVDVNTIVNSSLDVEAQLTINAGVIFTVNGILTVNDSIINNGTLIVNGLIIKQVNIVNNGTITIN